MIKYKITLAQTGESKIIYGDGLHIANNHFSIIEDNKIVAIIPLIGFMIEEE